MYLRKQLLKWRWQCTHNIFGNWVLSNIYPKVWFINISFFVNFIKCVLKVNGVSRLWWRSLSSFIKIRFWLFNPPKGVSQLKELLQLILNWGRLRYCYYFLANNLFWEMFNSIITLNKIYIDSNRIQSEEAPYKNKKMSFVPISQPHAQLRNGNFCFWKIMKINISYILYFW